MSGRNLGQLLPGEKARVIKICGRGPVCRRLMEMGVVPGCGVEMERYAPLGDPVEIKLKGCHLSLRKEEAALVEVDREDAS